MTLNEDYRDILLALSAEKVKFLLVGAHAIAHYGFPRSTMDIDIWVQPTADNAQAVMRALARFGASLQGLTLEDLQHDRTVFQIGVAPVRIDIMTGVSGLEFEEVFARSITSMLDGIEVRLPSIEDLICNKKASGRPKDLEDAEAMEALKSKQERQ
ncbi:MAG: hypothetical protein FJY65_02165 [Calditrichaeota bacterium]|nr:hypothetical protein [Calditrichota bacterium]